MLQGSDYTKQSLSLAESLTQARIIEDGVGLSEPLMLRPIFEVIFPHSLSKTECGSGGVVYPSCVKMVCGSGG